MWVIWAGMALNLVDVDTLPHPKNDYDLHCKPRQKTTPAPEPPKEEDEPGFGGAPKKLFFPGAPWPTDALIISSNLGRLRTNRLLHPKRAPLSPSGSRGL